VSTAGNDQATRRIHAHYARHRVVVVVVVVTVVVFAVVVVVFAGVVFAVFIAAYSRLCHWSRNSIITRGCVGHRVYERDCGYVGGSGGERGNGAGGCGRHDRSRIVQATLYKRVRWQA